MSMARKCDRCNKLFEPNIKTNGFSGVYVKVVAAYEKSGIGLETIVEADLCKECAERFEKWIRGIG